MTHSSLIENIRKEQDAVFDKDFGLTIKANGFVSMAVDFKEYLHSRDQVILSTLLTAVEEAIGEDEIISKKPSVNYETLEKYEIWKLTADKFGIINQERSRIRTILATLKANK